MNAEKMEELRQSIIKEINQMVDYPVVSNEEMSWVAECLRVAGPHFCMTEMRGSWNIVMSPKYYMETLRSISELFKSEKVFAYSDGGLSALRREYDEARMACGGVIQYLKNKHSDEKKKFEERTDLEEEIRNRYKRRY